MGSKNALKHRYWLMKSEPSDYSIFDLKRDRVVLWTGVRNYQVRNMFRDEIKKGDIALFYHSSTDEVGVVGEMEVTKGACADPSQFDPKDPHYDKTADPNNPRWLAVALKFKKVFPRTVTLAELRAVNELAGLRLLQKGNRLSVMPVEENHYRAIVALAESKQSTKKSKIA